MTWSISQSRNKAYPSIARRSQMAPGQVAQTIESLQASLDDYKAQLRVNLGGRGPF